MHFKTNVPYRSPRLDAWIEERCSLIGPVEFYCDANGKGRYLDDYEFGVVETLQDLIDMLNKEKTQ